MPRLALRSLFFSLLALAAGSLLAQTTALSVNSAPTTLSAASQPAATRPAGFRAATQPTPYRTGMRMSDFRVHDPFILPYAPTHTYYLYTAASPRDTGERRFGVLTYKSKDLITWEGPKIVYKIADGGWANPMHGAWAPEVHAFNGKYYLFVTLHNNDKSLGQSVDPRYTAHLRGTIICAADSPEGPFTPLQDRPTPPEDFMTLDGTFYVDPAGAPWMIYAHEWVQILDGTMEAIPLKPDLSAAAGDPIYLFKASDAPWLRTQKVQKGPRSYVTDGPFLYRTKTGKLLMLWASYKENVYQQTLARSDSDTLAGPWTQLPILIGNDSGHGMLFKTFDGQLMLVLHRPFGQPTTRAKLYEMEDAGDTLNVIRQRRDLDGSAEGG